MAQFVNDSEGNTKSIILHDWATTSSITHRSKLCQAWNVNGDINS